MFVVSEATQKTVQFIEESGRSRSRAVGEDARLAYGSGGESPGKG